MILLFYHQMQYEYFEFQFQDFKEYEIVNVQKMYLYDVESFYSFLLNKINII
jgi:hypothetical protein